MLWRTTPSVVTFCHPFIVSGNSDPLLEMAHVEIMKSFLRTGVAARFLLINCQVGTPELRTVTAPRL